jgi:hypothetical protein
LARRHVIVELSGVTCTLSEGTGTVQNTSFADIPGL